MSTPRISLDLDVSWLAPGLLLYGRTGAPAGGSAVFRLVSHSGVACRPTTDGKYELAATKAVARYVALYSITTIRNGWEPFAQPAPAAYVPRGYKELIRVAFNEHTLLIERNAYRGTWSSLVARDDEYALLAGGATVETLRPAAEWIASATNESDERVFEIIVALSHERIPVTRAA